MSQGRLVTHWAVHLMEAHFVAYTEVKEKSDIASVYVAVIFAKSVILQNSRSFCKYTKIVVYLQNHLNRVVTLQKNMITGCFAKSPII